METFLRLQLRHEPVRVVNYFKSENNYFFKNFRNFLLFYDIKRFITGGYGLLRRTGSSRNGSYVIVNSRPGIIFIYIKCSMITLTVHEIKSSKFQL